jgi:hypothetical protein
MWLLVDRDAPLVAGITLAIASRVEPMALLAAPVALAAVATGAGGGSDDDHPARRSRLVHFGGALAGGLFAAWVPPLAWGWDSLKAAPGGGSAPRGARAGGRGGTGAGCGQPGVRFPRLGYPPGWGPARVGRGRACPWAAPLPSNGGAPANGHVPAEQGVRPSSGSFSLPK